MLAETLLRWVPLGNGQFQVRCPWCGQTVEFYPRYRDWFCPGKPGKLCGHNATVSRAMCNCPRCETVEE